MYILNIYKREFLEREIAMAYDNKVEAVKRLDIGASSVANDSLRTSLEQPSVQGRINKNQQINVDPSMNGNSPSEVGGTTSPSAKPKAIKADYKDPKTIVNAMVFEGLNNRNDVLMKLNINDNPFLR